MKRFSTLLLSTLFSLSLLAYDGTRLTVSSVSNMKLRVEVDGRRYAMDKKTLTIRDLPAGHHTVKIYRDKKKNSGWLNKRQELVYSGSVYLRRDYHLDITINRFGKTMVDERRIDKNDDWYEEDDDYYDPNDRWDNRNNRWEDNTRPPMSDYEFRQAMETLRREWLESARLNSAKQVLDRNYHSSRQVKEILQLFKFESNRLDLAKWAYARTTDKRNYHIISEVFSHSNSREELARYIREFR